MSYLKAKMKDANLMCKVFYIMTGLLIINRFFTFIMMLFFANYGGINVEGYAKSSNILLSLLSANNFNPVKKTIQASAAGTTPILLYSSQKGNIEKKSVSCEPLGVEKTTSYRDIQFTVSQGDIIITYTDGLVEALNSTGKQYSTERLASVIKENCKLSGKEIASLVKTDIKKFIGSESLHDDQTLLLIKIQ